MASTKRIPFGNRKHRYCTRNLPKRRQPTVACEDSASENNESATDTKKRGARLHLRRSATRADPAVSEGATISRRNKGSSGRQKRNKKATTAAIETSTEPLFVKVGKQTYSRRQQLAKAVADGRELTDKQRVAALMCRFGKRTYAGKKRTKPDPVVGVADAQSVIDLGPSTLEPSQLLLSENRELTDWDTAAQKLGAASVPIRFVGLATNSRLKVGGKSTFASCAGSTTACLRTTESKARMSVVGDGRGAERPYKVRVKLEPVELLEDSVSREEEIAIPDLHIRVKLEPVELLEDSVSREEKIAIPDLHIKGESVLVRVKTEPVDTLEDNG